MGKFLSITLVIFLSLLFVSIFTYFISTFIMKKRIRVSDKLDGIAFVTFCFALLVIVIIVIVEAIVR